MRTFELYLTSRVNASGSVEVATAGFTQTFTTTPGMITTIKLPADPQGLSVELYQSEVISPGFGVHITADQDIEVFVLSHIIASSDAFMALPVEATGTDYLTMNYPVELFHNPQKGTQPYNSQFTIVGEYDSTTVTITPSATTKLKKAAGQPFTILLNSGDAYMLQGDSNAGNDLTGSLIHSDKPVAVISGHESTSIPAAAVDDSGRSAPSNQLLEDIPPIPSWGSSAIVVPFRSSEKPDLIRILSAEDNNAITINGTVAATLNKGQFYEITAIPGPLVITASAPILTAQYSHSNWDELAGYGDPSFVLDYPVEQFDTEYEINSITTATIDDGINNKPAFDSNFVNIAVDMSGIASMQMDGVPIAANLFSLIPGSTFAFAQIAATPGPHHFNGSVPFGLTVYGFGSYDAYSYPGGAVFHDLEPATLRFVPFDSTLLCQPEDRSIWVKDPGDEPSQLSAVSLDGQSPVPFSVTTQLPITIQPGDSVQVIIHFAPISVGNYSATVKLSFNQPRNQSYDVPILATAMPSPILALHAYYPTQLVDYAESFYLPILVDSTFLNSGTSSATVVLSHTPRLYNLGDIFSTNTLASGAYLSYVSSADADTIFIQFQSPLSSGALQTSSGNAPLLLVRLDPIQDIETPNATDSCMLSASLGFSGSSLSSDCYTMKGTDIKVLVGALCDPPILSNDTLITPGSAIDHPYPNPASKILEVPVVVGTNCVSTSGSTTLSVQIVNVVGQTLERQDISDVQAGRLSVPLNIGSLPSGEYFVLVWIGSDELVQKFLHR
ncbi:MAG TPA: T9SS type A sorting domain-containing protein [Candidatus Kapabacteria bacterium]|nr:T9SS type A sorting domain-containing protein [Candidatus Kapabacteria bacterium]